MNADEAEVAGGGWWDGAGVTALGLARDAVPVASTVTRYSFAAAQRGVQLGLSMGEAMVSGGGQAAAVGAAALGATGVVSAPVASTVGVGVRASTVAAGLSVRGAHAVAAWGLSVGQAVSRKPPATRLQPACSPPAALLRRACIPVCPARLSPVQITSATLGTMESALEAASHAATPAMEGSGANPRLNPVVRLAFGDDAGEAAHTGSQAAAPRLAGCST